MPFRSIYVPAIHWGKMLRYAITDRRLALSGADGVRFGNSAPQQVSAAETQALVERCAALARQGIEFLLIREKDLAAGELVALCRSVLEAVRERTSSTRVLVASRADVALAAGLDGVHLASGSSELTPSEVRRLYARSGRAEPFVTASCHTLEDVLRARSEAASAGLFAPVFGKMVEGVQVAPSAGLETLYEACREAAPMPVLALGGVTWKNAPDCLRAGAAGVAGIRLFMAPPR